MIFKHCGKVVFGILTKCHRNENQEIIDLAHKVLENYRRKTYFDDFKYHFPSLFSTQYWNQSAKIFSLMTKQIIDQRSDVNSGDFIDRLKIMKIEGLDEKLVNAQGTVFEIHTKKSHMIFGAKFQLSLNFRIFFFKYLNFRAKIR